jgi:hypothetical protein
LLGRSPGKKLPHFGIGFVETWIEQVNDDLGAPAVLNGFVGRAFGIGPHRIPEILITANQIANEFGRARL